jgi:hypothetical protein
MSLFGTMDFIHIGEFYPASCCMRFRREKKKTEYNFNVYFFLYPRLSVEFCYIAAKLHINAKVLHDSRVNWEGWECSLSVG